MSKPNSAKAILIGGLIAGACDITYAFIFYYFRNDVTPARVLRSVASGAFGAAAFTGGTKMVVLGAVFHFFIAIGAAAVYYLASRILSFLLNQAIISGFRFGTCV